MSELNNVNNELLEEEARKEIEIENNTEMYYDNDENLTTGEVAIIGTTIVVAGAAGAFVYNKVIKPVGKIAKEKIDEMKADKGLTKEEKRSVKSERKIKKEIAKKKANELKQLETAALQKLEEDKKQIIEDEYNKLVNEEEN